MEPRGLDYELLSIECQILEAVTSGIKEKVQEIDVKVGNLLQLVEKRGAKGNCKADSEKNPSLNAEPSSWKQERKLLRSELHLIRGAFHLLQNSKFACF